MVDSIRNLALFYNGVGTTRRNEWSLVAEGQILEHPIEVQDGDLPNFRVWFT